MADVLKVKLEAPVLATQDPLIDNKLPGISGFLQTLAGYYCQFLETDFKKAREPKRKFSRKDRSGNRVGVRVSKYPSFRELLISKLDQSSLASFVVKPKKYRATLSATVEAAIRSAIEAVQVEGLAADLERLRQQLTNKFTKPGFDIEVVAEEVLGSIRRLVEQHLVTPVLDVVAPVLEREVHSSIALDQLVTYTEEIVSVLTEEAEGILPDALGTLAFRNSDTKLLEAIRVLCDESQARRLLGDYFSEFVASDVFTELREILSNYQITENTQIYLNFGEIQTAKSRFPLYFIPVTTTIEPEGIRLNFEPHLFANKKAVEFVVGVISKERGAPIINPLSERIFYKQDNETYIQLASRTFHKILHALQVEGEVDLSTSGNSAGIGAGVKVTNDISISLFDKSDESIVNDYEALMTGLEGGSELLAVFSDLVENFLTTNPTPIEEDIDKEWFETSTPDRLVFQSPLPLAEEQRKVLSAIRHPKGRLIVVEGPPGTGKSHTIAAIAFEMILKGQNILILSDKKEALDVAEGKLNDVIKRVRGIETEYVNPILRLGKTDSNFSNIIKTNSIEKLRTSLQTFKSQETRFNEAFQKSEATLKKEIEQTIAVVGEIGFSDLSAFHEEEQTLFDRYPVLDSLGPDEDLQMATISRMADFVASNRKEVASLFAGSEKLEQLGKFVNLSSAIDACSEEVVSLLRRYPRINLSRADELSKISRQITELRKPIIGYLFSGAALGQLALHIKEITGEIVVKPQKRLDELGQLAGVRDTLERILVEYGGEAGDLETYKDFVVSDLRCSKDEASLLTDYLATGWEEFENRSMPVTIKALLGLGQEDREMFTQYVKLQDQRNKLAKAFDEIPDFDYLKEKSHLETMNATRLTNRIDERVIAFATNNKADAKTLQKIIRNKEKFPTDKFDVLKQAFPCMIAGLRDFAEFIPLKENLFDLIIIDEASQVSIAQALPAILRAKKVLVLGDRRQFGNVKTANASKLLNQGYFSQVKNDFNEAIAKGDTSLMTRVGSFNITNSVMDFFEMTNNYSVQLKKHFRGYPEMISFSGKFFYDESLQALKIRGRPIGDVLEFVEVEDPDRAEVVRNVSRQEADLIVNRLVSLCDTEDPPSVAVITPFREQLKLLSIIISDHECYEEFIKKLRLAVFTFDTCQGEERDVVFYSMVGNRGHDGLNYIFPMDIRGVSEDEIDGKLKFQRLNVGFSRGKEKLVFVLSKPVVEYKGAIGQALKHYASVLENARSLPSAGDVDASSPMEEVLLEWIKKTGFAAANSDSLEINPQFKLGAYLKALNPGYVHPEYKVDFLLRLNTGAEVLQVIIEYDGFEYHFTNQGNVDALNWRSYLTHEDVERECILESYGYKMLRVNRFNIGKDPVSTLDTRLRTLFEQLGTKDEQHEAISKMQEKTHENIKGLDDGTHRKCSGCSEIKPREQFYDKNLKANYGRLCKTCKGSRSASRARRYRRNPKRWW